MNSKKKKYLIFPKLHLKHILFLFFFIIACIKRWVQLHFEKEGRIEIAFLNLYIYDIGDFLTIIPFFIVEKRSQSQRANNASKNNKSDINIKYLYNNRVQERIKASTFKFIIFTIVNFIPQIAFIIYYVIILDHNYKLASLNSLLIFCILSVVLFSIVILHTKFYKHHFFSILIDALCLITLGIIDIKNIINNNNKAYSIIFLFIKILSEILYSLANIMAKQLFLYHYYTTFA